MWKIWAILKKDLLTELRSRETLPSMILFSLLVVLMFNFTFEPGSEAIVEALPGILWVAIIFAGTLGLNRSFVSEQEEECLQGLLLCPLDRGVLYLGKMLGNLLFILIMEGLVFPIFAILFNLDIVHLLLPLMPVFFLATVGFAALGTLFSAMAVNTKAREVLLPILLFPLTVPIVLGAVKTTGTILNGSALTEGRPWLQMMTVFDIIFLVAAFLTFEFVVEE